MPKACDCSETHKTRRVVLTGGPGAGKTAVLELIRQDFCKHVKVLPESASILFGGGFPRDGSSEVRQAGQRAIFYVQRELESVAGVENPAIVLWDRGTVDGSAYWAGVGSADQILLISLVIPECQRAFAWSLVKRIRQR
jgi:predicted ATPase